MQRLRDELGEQQIRVHVLLSCMQDFLCMPQKLCALCRCVCLCECVYLPVMQHRPLQCVVEIHQF